MQLQQQLGREVSALDSHEMQPETNLPKLERKLQEGGGRAFLPGVGTAEAGVM